MAKESLGQWLSREPFTLALSSSFFGFFAHCGFSQALAEAKIQPAGYSGASAGALVAAGLASGLKPTEMREIFFALDRQDFWDPAPGPGLLRGRKFLQLLQRNFHKDFSGLARPLSVAAFDLLSCRTRFLKTGPLPAAVLASCAVPLLFRPVRIGARVYLDGGLFSKSGVDPQLPGRHLCVFLPSQGLLGAYEWNTQRRLHSPHLRTVRLDGLPQVLPHRLSTGRDAYEMALGLGRDLLRQPVSGNLASTKTEKE